MKLFPRDYITLSENGNLDDIDFYLDPSLIDLDIVKRIGIEKSTNSNLVEACNQIVIQTIVISSFSDKTINPLRRQLNEILIGLPQDKKKTMNSIITCINKNIRIISEYCNSHEDRSPEHDDANKVDDFINLILEPENTDKLFIDQYEKPFAAVRIGEDRHLEILPMNSKKFKTIFIKVISR